MGFDIHDRGFRNGLPWEQDAAGFLRSVKAAVEADSLVLGVVARRGAKPDELLGTHNVDREALERWCAGGVKADPSLREACRKGVAEPKSSKLKGPALPAGQQAVVVTESASLRGDRYWYLAAGRGSGSFDEPQVRAAKLVVRLLAVTFDHAQEVGLGRVLLGEDFRVLTADPSTQAWFAEEPEAAKELTGLLPRVIEQRWPKLKDRAMHDMVLPVGSRELWVRFRQGRASVEAPGQFWYAEIRPREEDDLPPVGLVEDERIAESMAYLSDHYAESPSLTEVSKVADVSPFHFHRLFSRQARISPKHYVLRMQLMMGKWMLRASRKAIGKIAVETGFASHGHFTATFHRMVGMSPTEYREQE